MSLHYERGPMIVEDVRALPRVPLVIVEGSNVSPAIISTGEVERSRAVWLLPTSEFLSAEGLSGGGFQGLLRETISREVHAHKAPTLTVDSSRGVAEITTVVEELFAAALREGPRAETLMERRALLREANEQVVSQCRDYLARPWSEGDPRSFVRAFVCECDDPECDELVELPIAAATDRIFAPDHR